METAERIDSPAPLPESPANDLLTKMLVPAPYKGPEKKADKKAPGTRKGLRSKVTQASSEDDEAHSSPEGEEQEEAAPSRKDGGRRWRTRGPGEALGVRPSYPCRLMTTRRIPPAEAGRNKEKNHHPVSEEGRRGRPPRWGRLGRPRMERHPFRTTPPPPPIARKGGCPGRSPLCDHKYPHSIVIFAS